MSITKRIIAFLLAITMLSQTISVIATLVEFQTNRTYYAEVLCINKKRPELACEGKCVLMQKMHNQFDFEQTKQAHKLYNLLEKDVVWLCETYTPNALKAISALAVPKSILFHYHLLPSRLCELGIFHPPTYLV